MFAKVKNKGIFQTTPRPQTEDYSTTHLDKGTDYHRLFDQQPGRKMIWNLEKRTFAKIISERAGFDKHLDFAGGTGRIAGLIAPHCKEQVVLDISPKMLEVAREHLPGATMICSDFNEPVPEIRDTDFDLITAFRFFPNAEKSLRESAMQFIVRKLRNDGILICNNQRNFWSILYTAKRLFFYDGFVGMTNREMKELADRNGLKLVRTYSLGVIPQDKRAILPWRIAGLLERLLYRLSATWQTAGHNVIFVFEKK